MKERLCGRTPGIPLNDTGRLQAHALGERLRGNIDRIVSSPMERTMETAIILAQPKGLQTEAMPSFTEFDFGDWTGRTFEDLTTDPAWREFNQVRDRTRPPGGESMQEVLERAMSGLRQLVKEDPDRTIAIVTHADVIRSLILHVTGMPIRNFWRLAINPASITEILCGPEGDERVIRLNDCAHLDQITV